MAEACGIDPKLKALCEKPFSLTLATAGVPGAAHIVCSGTSVSASFGARPAGVSSGFLLFPSARACARALSGGSGLILPLPIGPGFGRALRFFKAAAGRAPELLRSKDTASQDKARLLLAATFHGLAAVAPDPYLEKRMEHIPDGIVEARAGSAAMFAEKLGPAIRVLDPPPPGVADALLSFASPESAIAVLTGKRQAVVALGTGEVAIAGLLPLVQGLFSVLDRLSWYLDVENEEEKR